MNLQKFCSGVTRIQDVTSFNSQISSSAPFTISWRFFMKETFHAATNIFFKRSHSCWKKLKPKQWIHWRNLQSTKFLSWKNHLSVCKFILNFLQINRLSTGDLDDKMKWLKNFERLLEIQRNVVWPGNQSLLKIISSGEKWFSAKESWSWSPNNITQSFSKLPWWSNLARGLLSARGGKLVSQNVSDSYPSLDQQRENWKSDLKFPIDKLIIASTWVFCVWQWDINMERVFLSSQTIYYISKSPVARGRFRPRQVIPRAKGWFGLKSLPRAQPAGVISTQINPMPEGLLDEV